MSKQYQNYHHSLTYTYAFGHFAAEALLLSRPHLARELLLHSDLDSAWMQRLTAAAKPHGIPVRVANREVERIRKKPTVFAVLVLHKEEDVLTTGAHVMLAGVSHYGNFGTIMRTMVAFGFSNLVLVASPLDAWNPHALRASVGLRGSVQVASFATVRAYEEAHPHQQYVQLHTHHAVPLTHAEQPTAPCTIVFGPEWPANDALNHELSALPGARVRIEQSSAAESLNLATAVAIVLHQWRGL